MLASLHDKPFDDPDWVFEIKWDGYRAIADLREEAPLLYSRNGISFAKKFSSIANDLRHQPYDMVLDGEIVAYDAGGKPSFQLLQQVHEHPDLALVYLVFDLLWLNGHDTEKLPLLQRKELLKEALKESKQIQYCEHIPEEGIAFFEQLKQLQLEGMIAKRADSAYREGYRSQDWLKVKFTNTEECIICGFTAPRGSRKKFGALILGRYLNGTLTYSGHTGTGFNQKSLEAMYQRLKPLITPESPFARVPKTNAPVTWVQPQLVCEIKFTEITKDGIFRHPVFVGLREDKEAAEITDKPKAMPNKATKQKAGEEIITLNRHKIVLTNQDKIYFPKEKITKGMVIDYYQSVADFILPHLKNRPLSLNRFPGGIEGDSFYQKDADEHTPKWIKTTQVFSESTDKYIDYIVCNNQATLAYLNNLGCIDLNPWTSRFPELQYPDYLVLDLDPSAKNTFNDVIETALQVKEVLDAIKVKGYCKTSGSTGIHVYIPMGGLYAFEQVKDFAHLLMQQVNEQLPELTTLERSLKKRSDRKIYLDYLQNRQGQSLASAYSLRPKPGAPVSMPLDWAELKKGLKPTDYNIYNALERMQQKGDLFKPVMGRGINMEKALERLGDL